MCLVLSMYAKVVCGHRITPVTIIMMITHYRNILCFPIKNTTEGILTSTAYVVAQHTSIVCILSCKLETKSLDKRIEAPILQLCSPIYNNSALT